MSKKKDLIFEGFRFPTYTQVPDEVFDVLMPDLTETELKCLLYIIRRTFGFKKDRDPISTKQFTDGIVTRDGRQLDRGTGLSNKGVWSGLKGLEEKHIVEVERRWASDGDYETNIYRLRFREEGVTTSGRYPYYQKKEGVTTSGSRQDTVLQDTDSQDTDNSKFEGPPDKTDFSPSQNPPPTFSTGPHSENIGRIVSDFSKHILHDPNHTKSNITQAHNIWHESGLAEEEFIEALHTAKRTVLEWSGSIRKLADEKTGLKNRAPYFFRVLRDLTPTPISREQK